MSDVAVTIVKASLVASERRGIPRAQLLGGDSVTEGDLLHRRAPWPRFCVFNDRLEAAWKPHGGVAGFARAFSADAPPEMSALGRALIPPKQFLRLVFALGGWIHPSVAARVEEPAPGVLELELSLEPRLQPDSPAFFRFCAATLGHSTLLIGLPETPVEMELFPRRARYRFRVPPSKTVFARLQSAVDQGASSLLAHIEDLQAEVRELIASRADGGRDVESRLRERARQWGLSPRQTDVLRLLCEGASNKEIGSRLGAAERTVEIHVTELLRKSGTGSRARLVAEFWSRP